MLVERPESALAEAGLGVEDVFAGQRLDREVLAVQFLHCIRSDREGWSRHLFLGIGEGHQQHLAAGRPIYYGDARYPGGLVKKYPDGRKQLVSISADGKVTVIRDI